MDAGPRCCRKRCQLAAMHRDDAHEPSSAELEALLDYAAALLVFSEHTIAVARAFHHGAPHLDATRASFTTSPSLRAALPDLVARATVPTTVASPPRSSERACAAFARLVRIAPTLTPLVVQACRFSLRSARRF